MLAPLRTRPLLLGAALLLACAGEGDEGGDTVADTDTDTGAASTTTATSASTSTSSASTASTTSTSDATSSTSASTSSATTATTSTASDTSSGDTTTTGGVDPGGCTAEASELVALVNAYRGEKGLPAIPASPSLCTVGQTHVVDLQENAPHTEPGCNLHSWSDAGAWSPCCYTPDHAQAMCMWVKPQELTVYPGFGYENAAQSGGVITPAQALDLWKNSPAHNDVILNQGIWTDHPWKAVGAGLHQGYAVLWFGEETDPAG